MSQVKEPSKFKKFFNHRRAIMVKNYDRVKRKTLEHTQKFKQIIKDKSLSAKESREKLNQHVKVFIRDIKKDIDFNRYKQNTKPQWEKFIKLMPYILVALASLALANPILVKVFVQSISPVVAASTGFSIEAIAMVLGSMKGVFLNLKSLEQGIVLISFISLIFEEIPKWTSKSHFEAMSNQSFLSLLKGGLTNTLSVQNKVEKDMNSTKHLL
jgi:hypothetical protein